MVSEIFPHRQIGNDWHAEIPQQPGRPDAGDLQQPGGVGGPGGDYNLPPSKDLAAGGAVAVVDVFDTDGLAALEQNPRRPRIGSHVQPSRRSG